jgi:hypothetical protein
MSAGNDVRSVLLGYLEEARTDLIVFRLLSANSEEGVRRRALFHLQQASEKLAKTHVYYVMRIICEFTRKVKLDAQMERIVTRHVKKCNEVVYGDREKIIEFLKRDYGHNAKALVDLEWALYDLLKRPSAAKQLVAQLTDKAVAGLLSELGEKEREELSQRINDLFTKVKDFSIIILSRSVENKQPFSGYNEHNYGCVDDVLKRFRGMDGLSSEFDKLRDKVNSIVQQSPNAQKYPECKDMFNAMVSLTRGLVMAYAYSIIIDLPLVNCMGLFEQTSRYCLAEDESKCPPVDDESMRKYSEISRYLEEFMNNSELLIQALDQLLKVIKAMASGTSYNIPKEYDKYLMQLMRQCVLSLFKDRLSEIIDTLTSFFANATKTISQQTP